MINLLQLYINIGSIIAIPIVTYYYYLNTRRDVISLLVIYCYAVFTYPYLIYLFIKYEIN